MSQRVCPWWLGYTLIVPLRRLVNNPEEILKPHVREGMRILELGPGMGFFSLALARMVGSSGKVFCVDLQDKMLRTLNKRAAKANLSGIIEARLCSKESLSIDDIAGQIDFTLAFAVLHEVSDLGNMLRQVNAAMKHGATFLIAEPTNHVKKNVFEKIVSIAKDSGFIIAAQPQIKHCLAVLLKK
ncbi:MAG: class I SAM-dependent methyltransferase [Candidatus Omnitrophota bacterium]|jgi:ubiquinone/menaquinone biosynthesis C-methylase UbiE